MSELLTPQPSANEQSETAVADHPLEALQLIPQADLDDPDSISASMKVIGANLNTRPMRYTASAFTEIARLQKVMRAADEHPQDETLQQQSGSARLQFDEVKRQVAENYGDEALGIYQSLLSQKAKLSSRREELLSPHD